MANAIRKYGFKPGLPHEFEIVDLHRGMRDFAEHLTQSHRTEFFHIIWFRRGATLHWVDFQALPIPDNTLLFLNKDVVQRFAYAEGLEGKAILFTDKFFCKTEADVRFLHSSSMFYDLFQVSKIQSNGIMFGELLTQMEIELTHDMDAFQSDILQNLLHNLLLHAERSLQLKTASELKKGAELELVLQFRKNLDAAYREQKQVAYFARDLAVTEKHLNHATTKILGKSPKLIIEERVMLEARRLLAHTRDSVKEIGFFLGFDEPTNFVKFFRKQAGITPLAFRKQVLSA